MLIFNYKFGDPLQEDKIFATIGKPFSIWQKMKMGGSGFERMNIASASADIQQYIDQFNATAFANVDIRPNGILMIIAQNTRRIAWAIPFHYLSVFKSSSLNIHAEGSFVKVEMKTARHVALMNSLLERKREYAVSLEDFIMDNDRF